MRRRLNRRPENCVPPELYSAQQNYPLFQNSGVISLPSKKSIFCEHYHSRQYSQGLLIKHYKGASMANVAGMDRQIYCQQISSSASVLLIPDPDNIDGSEGAIRQHQAKEASF